MEDCGVPSVPATHVSSKGLPHYLRNWDEELRAFIDIWQDKAVLTKIVKIWSSSVTFWRSSLLGMQEQSQGNSEEQQAGERGQYPFGVFQDMHAFL